MRRYKHLSSTARVVARNKILTISLVIITVLQLLSYSTIREFSQTHRTIVQPIMVDQPYWIDGSTASQAYLEMMGRDILSLLLTYHPDSVHYQYNTLTNLHNPAYYAETKEFYQGTADRIKQTGFSSVFYPSRFTLSPESILVTGTRTRFTLTGKSEKQERYQIDYIIRHGTFEIKTIKEVTES